MVPSAAGRTALLDPAGDIADPIGAGEKVYEQCARRIVGALQVRIEDLQI